MKKWFKYRFGYVNIDDENFYLTNSGNWSETIDMNEKTKKTEKKGSLKKFRINVYLYVVAGISLCLICFGGDGGRIIYIFYYGHLYSLIKPINT